MMARSAWLFPGQGAQHVGMGVDIVDHWPIAAKTMTRCSEVAGFDLVEACRFGPEDRLARTELTQPAVLSVSLAILEAARPQLSPPVMLAGHSLGEFTALVAAGALQLEDAMRLVCARGQLMRAAVADRPVSMVATIGVPTAVVETICRELDGAGVCEIAAYNDPGQVVLSGDVGAVDAARSRIAECGGETVELRVSAGFHTSILNSVASEFESLLKAVIVEVPRWPVALNVSGMVTVDPEKIRRGLAGQIDHPVAWTAVLERLQEAGTEQIVEIGPGRTLSAIAKRYDRRWSVSSIAKMADLGVPDPHAMTASRR